eukprot:TRINITY_DN10247_c1_g3_i2.p3 TRINITY_DN10247_c1_g3~~TRINITY_DN10247_c1_g3_i2.p3  ORF type:complete len:256 (+),score=-20.14 TRINITY_DN10247_c1_g3_i2:405-1172(+)
MQIALFYYHVIWSFFHGYQQFQQVTFFYYLTLHNIPYIIPQSNLHQLISLRISPLIITINIQTHPFCAFYEQDSLRLKILNFGIQYINIVLNIGGIGISQTLGSLSLFGLKVFSFSYLISHLIINILKQCFVNINIVCGQLGLHGVYLGQVILVQQGANFGFFQQYVRNYLVHLVISCIHFLTMKYACNCYKNCYYTICIDLPSNILNTFAILQRLQSVFFNHQIIVSRRYVEHGKSFIFPNSILCNSSSLSMFV